MLAVRSILARLPAPPEAVARFYRKHIRPLLPDVSFISLHWLYFICTTLLSSLIFWGCNTETKVSYTDSLFLCVSAMTEAGLNTVNLSELNTAQQTILFLLIVAGSAIFVSSWVLHIRKRAFEKKLGELAEKRARHSLHLSRTFTFSRTKSRRRNSVNGRENAIASGVLRGRVINDQDPKPDPDDPTNRLAVYNEGTPATPALPVDTQGGQPEAVQSPVARSSGHITFQDTVRSPVAMGDTVALHKTISKSHRPFIAGGVGVRSMDNHPRNSQPLHPRADVEQLPPSEENTNLGRFGTFDHWIRSRGGLQGRNSQFHNLTEKERRKLGGIEYDAVSVLSVIVPLYFVLWQLLGAVGVGAYLQSKRPEIAYTNGLNPFWTGAFFAVSAFNNSGMALLDANAVAMQTSYYALLTMSLLILAGNTCFPPFLRLCVWSMRQCIPKSSTSLKWQKRRKILTFILDHPRRVYTNLFPAPQTWWLVFSLVMLNGVDWAAFEVLNIGNPTTDTIEPRYRVLDGLFQAFAVRSGGFYVVPIAGLRSGLLVLYVLMMYISALPVTITIRHSNVYEERSLGVYAEDANSSNDSSNEKQGAAMPLRPISRTNTLKRILSGQQGIHQSTHTQDLVRQQLRGQLGHDLWWIALAVLFITITETGQFERNPVVFSTFNIVFEVVSGYGTVGISTGVPWAAYSFCGAWHTLSKLILCLVMLRGRHRGLPVAIDKAVLLPDETLAWAEEEDGRYRQMKRDQQMQLRDEGRRRSGTWTTGVDLGGLSTNGNGDLERGRSTQPMSNGGVHAPVRRAEDLETKDDNEKLDSEEVRQWHINDDEQDTDGDNTVARRKVAKRMDDAV